MLHAYVQVPYGSRQPQGSRGQVPVPQDICPHGGRLGGAAPDCLQGEVLEVLGFSQGHAVHLICGFHLPPVFLML